MANPIKQYNEIVLPKLDDSQKAPFQQATSVVSSYDGLEFENFILEWLKYCRKKITTATLIERIGGSGDNGVDIYENTNGTINYYQCKKYMNALTLPQMRQIVIKVLWHAFNKHIDYPNSLYIIVFKGMNDRAAKCLSNKEELKESLINNCKQDLTAINVTEDSTDFLVYLRSIKDFNFVQKINLDDIVKEYCLSDYAVFRFITAKNIKIDRVKANQKTYDDDPYVQQLNRILNKNKVARIQRAKEQFYSALCLQETDRYLYGTNIEFCKLKQEISSNIETTRYNQYVDLDARFSAIIQSALYTDAGNVSLQYSLHMVCADDKAGICHMMVNNKELSWEHADE